MNLGNAFKKYHKSIGAFLFGLYCSFNSGEGFLMNIYWVEHRTKFG